MLLLTRINIILAAEGRLANTANSARDSNSERQDQIQKQRLYILYEFELAVAISSRKTLASLA